MRQGLPVLLLALLVLVGGIVGYQLLFRRGEVDGVEVLETEGAVTRTAADGQRAPLLQGDVVGAREGVEVGDGARAVLGVGEGTRLELQASTSVRVLGVDGSGVRVELEQGRVRARVRAGGPALGLSSQGRAIYADDADFLAGVDAAGAFQVQAERGAVQLEGLDGTGGTLAAGEELTALPGGPAVVGPAAAGLLLEVGWPEEEVLRASALRVSGRTDPYAAVRVEGEGGQAALARADGQGAFAVDLPLEEGENRVRVEATDVLGSTRREELSITRDSQPPQIGGSEVQWGR